MDRWQETIVGDICDSISDTYRRKSDKVVLINTSDVFDGEVLNHKYVPNVNLRGQFKKTFQKDDILFSEIRPANKRFAYVDFDDTQDYIASTKLMVLRPDKKRIRPLYLYFYLKSKHVLAQLQYLAESRSGTFPQITFDSELSRLLMKLPDMRTQDKIIDVLSCIDDKINTNVAINKNLEEQAQTIFKAWFVDFEPFGGKMPIDFSQTTLGHIAKIKTRSMSPQKNPNVIVEHYSIPAYDEKHYPVFESTSEIKSNKYILTNNSVMISKLNPDIKRIWRPLCLSDNPVCSTEFIVYEATKPEYRDFLYSLIDSTDFYLFLCAHKTGSTNSRQRATPGTTLDFEFNLPSTAWIEKFCSIVTPIYDMIGSNIVENQALAKQRDILLPRLMSGEIDISNVDI